MATLAELAIARTDLGEPVVDHLLRLTASWGLLADLAFSDLLLMAPTREDPETLVVLGQVRPNNRATLINDDLVGSLHPREEWVVVARALDEGQRATGDARIPAVDESVALWAVPVRAGDRVVAVLVRVLGPLRGPASLYEQAYLGIFIRLCDMVADGTFPFREEEVGGATSPRVGDGIILLERDGRVEFATPNATNALHRLGIYASPEGRSFVTLGLKVRAAERALAFGQPRPAFWAAVSAPCSARADRPM